MEEQKDLLPFLQQELYQMYDANSDEHKDDQFKL